MRRLQPLEYSLVVGEVSVIMKMQDTPVTVKILGSRGSHAKSVSAKESKKGALDRGRC